MVKQFYLIHTAGKHLKWIYKSIIIMSSWPCPINIYFRIRSIDSWNI